jgi:hypothetical protein
MPHPNDYTKAPLVSRTLYEYFRRERRYWSNRQEQMEEVRMARLMSEKMLDMVENFRVETAGKAFV